MPYYQTNPLLIDYTSEEYTAYRPQSMSTVPNLFISNTNYDYDSENKDLINYFNSTLFCDSKHLYKDSETVEHPELGTVEWDGHSLYFQNLNAPKNYDEYVMVRKKIPKIFEAIENFIPNKKTIYTYIGIIGYKDVNNYVTEHVHYRRNANYVGVYYFEENNSSYGTQYWDGSTWHTFEEKSGNFYIFDARLIHRFKMRDSDKKRIIMSITFRVTDI